MSDQQQSGLDQLEERVEEMHGHRMAVSMQKSRELSPKEAVRAQAEADTFERVLNAIEYVREGKEIPDDIRESYVNLSRAMREANKAASEKTDDKEFLKGLAAREKRGVSCTR